MYSEEILEKVKEYAGYLLLPDQIAQLLELDKQEFKDHLRKKRHPLSKAYENGKLETILELRKQEIQLAKLGSPMAVEMVSKFIIEQKQGER
ncbi:MAG: hypothetical protein QM503_10700 [Bacteroidota bacterium]